jgi:hypothetical protein
VKRRPGFDLGRDLLAMPGGLLMVTLAALSLLAACGNGDAGDSPVAASQDDDEDGLAADPGMQHVHGLGINPADGLLYVATHTGLFRLGPDGPPERVSERHHDFMGFTVVGPDHFLTSGHPDLRDYREGRLPPLLGLMESTDGGRTWLPVALVGEVDFHALRVLNSTVYGYDSSSGAFMVSSDGGDWDRRSSLRLFDFVVHPDQPEMIIATTKDGLTRSDDGGRTWDGVQSSPILLWLDWEPGGELFGLDPDGRVYDGTNQGRAWVNTGRVSGRPEALLVVDGALYVALQGGVIARSADSGETWTTIYQP